MGAFDLYRSRMNVKGESRRESSKNRALGLMGRKLPDSLSLVSVSIGEAKQDLVIIDTDKLHIKTIHCLPEETIAGGTIIDWMENRWLVTGVDAHSELYVTGTIQRCNYELFWINEADEIVSRHCIMEDGTKYLTGVYDERIMGVGDARMALTIGKDSETVQIHRGRRFLVDDPDTERPLAYEVTKTNKLFGLYCGEGVHKYILTEVNSTDDDNFDLMIADYYKFRPEEKPVKPPSGNTGGWL